MGKRTPWSVVMGARTTGIVLAVPVFFLACFWAGRAEAIPAFSREYKTECTTCHTIYPQRNEFGQAFEDNGFVWPGAVPMAKKLGNSQTEEERKFAEFIMLSGIPRELPLSVALNVTYLYDDEAEDELEQKRVSAEMCGAGAFANDKIGFWYNQGLGGQSGATTSAPSTPSQLYFVVRGLLGAPVNLKAGKFQPNLSIWRGSDHLIGRPQSAGFSLGASPNATVLSTAQNGLELTSVLGSRVYVALGINDRNNSTSADSPHSVNDFYGRVSAKIGGADYHGKEPDIDLDRESVWDYLSVTFGGFGYDGTGSTGDGVDRDLSRYGGEFGLAYKKFLLMAGYSAGEYNSNADTKLDATAWSVEANYVLNLQWALAVRYDAVEVDAKDDRAILTGGIVWAPLQCFKLALRVVNDTNPANAATGKAEEKTTVQLSAGMSF